MKFQDSSFNGLKVTVGTKSVTHARTHARSKSNMPHQLFQSWGHKKVFRSNARFHEGLTFECLWTIKNSKSHSQFVFFVILSRAWAAHINIHQTIWLYNLFDTHAK